MPSATEEKIAPKIIDPASEHGEEIDASVDRDRIRVVRAKQNLSQICRS
jgi:DNA-directed RNA polymerase I and III subunit RPAC2